MLSSTATYFFPTLGTQIYLDFSSGASVSRTLYAYITQRIFSVHHINFIGQNNNIIGRLLRKYKNNYYHGKERGVLLMNAYCFFFFSFYLVGTQNTTPFN